MVTLSMFKAGWQLASQGLSKGMQEAVWVASALLGSREHQAESIMTLV